MKIKKRLLLIAPYPIIKPKHGGQKRTSALYDFYSENFLEVKFCAIFNKTTFREDEYKSTDICLGDPEILEKINSSPHAGELLVGESISKDFHVRSQFAKLLMEYKPNIIHVEQVFLYAGLKELLRDLNMSPKIVFGSQNIEYLMKVEIFKGLSLNQSNTKKILIQIRELEEAFSRDADLVIAVSENDAKAHRAMGAKRVVIANNGIKKIIPSKNSINKWKKFKQARRIKGMATFVGSGHPPNWFGFIKMIGEDTSFIKSGYKFVSAGGVAGYFNEVYKKSTPKGKLFWKSMIGVQHINDDELAGLIQESDILLLPITSGGGSNLKTAEAILSGKKVIATSFAFRGFEEYKYLPNIYIADRPSDFKKLINNIIGIKKLDRSIAQQQQVERVQWTYTLEPIKSELKYVALPDLKKQTKRAFRRIIRKTRVLILNLKR